MDKAPAGILTWRVALRLGHVSNLPTVWTNALVGFALAGGALDTVALLPLMFVLSLFYTACMYLIDALDANVDASERPERPIPAGLANRHTVLWIGFGLIALAVLLAGIVDFGIVGSAGAAALTAGLAGAAAIVAHNRSHKSRALGPLLTGLCRFLVYVVAALAAARTLPLQVLIAGGAMWAYTAGAICIAQQEAIRRPEHLWLAAILAIPAGYVMWLAVSASGAALYALLFLMWVCWSVWPLTRRPGGILQRRVVVDLFAGICLFDAVVLAGAGFQVLAGIAAALFLLTRYLQRWLPGT